MFALLTVPAVFNANEAVAGINVILVAALAVVANDAVLGINVILVAALDVVANEEVLGINVILVAALELIAFCAQLAVPNNDPVNELAETFP